MADKNLSSLTAATSLANTDLLYIVASSNSRKLQANNFISSLDTYYYRKTTIDTLVNSGERTVENLGIVNTGTITPEPSTGDMKRLNANGAFTLAAPSETGAYVLEVTNGTAAGTITLSGLTTVTGSASYATTSGKVYEFVITNYGNTKRIQIVDVA